jgi:iron complex transport system substrate-binding protein
MRILSLLASATETVAELGCLDNLVGRSHECDYPPRVLDLPVVSTVQIALDVSSAEIDAQVKEVARQRVTPENPALKALSVYAIDIEKVQELQPDVILTQTQCEVCAVSERDVVQAVDQLTGMRPRIVSLAPYRLQDVWEDVVRVGRALDRETQAQQLVQSYQQRLAALRAKTHAWQPKPTVAMIEWIDPLMGAGNWVPELVADAGGISVFGDIGRHSPWLTWEELRKADPDVIVLSPCGYDLKRTLQDMPLLQAHAEWSELRAVRSGRVYAVDGNAYLNRSGPRLVESAEILAHLLWGERVGVHVDRDAWITVL